MDADIVVMLLGSAVASVLPNAVVALYDWVSGIRTGR